jgi:phosphopantetheinyl transferase
LAIFDLPQRLSEQLQRELGVDVEQMRTGLAIDAVAARFFSPNECSALAAIAPELRCGLFFLLDSQRADLKARGDGLSQFDVAFVPGEEPRRRHDPAEANRGAACVQSWARL